MFVLSVKRLHCRRVNKVQSLNANTERERQYCKKCSLKVKKWWARISAPVAVTGMTLSEFILYSIIRPECHGVGYISAQRDDGTIFLPRSFFLRPGDSFLRRIHL